MENNEKDILDTDEGLIGGDAEKKEEKGKVQKAFNENLDKIEAVLGKKPDKKRKKTIPESRMDAIVADMWKEEDKRNEEEFQKELKAALDNYILFNEETQKKQNELNKLIETKQKEFNDKVGLVFRRLEGAPEVLGKRIKALKAAATASGAGGEAK